MRGMKQIWNEKSKVNMFLYQLKAHNKGSTNCFGLAQILATYSQVWDFEMESLKIEELKKHNVRQMF